MKILEGGANTGRLNLVCVSEGYTGQEKKVFEAHTRQLVAQIEKERWYRKGTLNVHALFVESRESARGLQADGVPKDTAFKAYYGGDRAAHVISGDDPGVAAHVVENFPGNVPTHIVVMVNSTLYGGRGGGKGGNKMWTYTDVQNPRRWTATALHELGHSLFCLADEYDGQGKKGKTNRTIEPKQPNITLDPRGARWRHLVQGAVEGADGYDLGIYRPTKNCRMRVFSVGDPGFCVVCQEAILRKLESYSDELPEPPDETDGDTSAPDPQRVGTPGQLSVQTPEELRVFEDNSGGAFEAAQYLLKRRFG